MDTLPEPPDLAVDSALLLDFDGTLVDIAPSPETIVVERGLVATLEGIARRLGGAVALISGRPIAELDHWLAPLRLPAAGVHGAERRRADGVVERRALPPLDGVAATALAIAAAHPGLRVERKTSAVALHYRGAPQHEALCLQAMHDAARREPGLRLLRGKQVVEVLPSGVGKGHAVAEFLREPPFAGRRPVFVGDDVTDEDGFEAVQRVGGVAVRVGGGDSVARHRLASPGVVRQWLAQALALPARHRAVV